MVKNLPANAGDLQVRSLGQEDPLQEDMAAHSSTLAEKNPMDRGAWRATVHGVVQSRDTTDKSSHADDYAERPQISFWLPGGNKGIRWGRELSWVLSQRLRG